MYYGIMNAIKTNTLQLSSGPLVDKLHQCFRLLVSLDILILISILFDFLMRFILISLKGYQKQININLIVLNTVAKTF